MPKSQIENLNIERGKPIILGEPRNFEYCGILIKSPEHLREILDFWYSIKIDDKEPSNLYPYVQKAVEKKCDRKLIDFISQHQVFVRPIGDNDLYVDVIDVYDDFDSGWVTYGYVSAWGFREDYYDDANVTMNDKGCDLEILDVVLDCYYQRLQKELIITEKFKNVSITPWRG